MGRRTLTSKSFSYSMNKSMTTDNTFDSFVCSHNDASDVVRRCKTIIKDTYSTLHNSTINAENTTRRITDRRYKRTSSQLKNAIIPLSNKQITIPDIFLSVRICFRNCLRRNDWILCYV